MGMQTIRILPDREASAQLMVQHERLGVKLNDGQYRIQSDSKAGMFYFVTLPAGSCTCPDFKYRVQYTGEDCKHIKLARMLEAV